MRTALLLLLLTACAPSREVRLEPVEGTEEPPVVAMVEQAVWQPGVLEAGLVPLKLVLGNRSFVTVDLARPMSFVLSDRDGEVARALPAEEAVDAIVIARGKGGDASKLLDATFHGPIPPGETRSGLVYVRTARPMAQLAGLVLDVRIADGLGGVRLLQARLPAH